MEGEERILEGGYSHQEIACEQLFLITLDVNVQYLC